MDNAVSRPNIIVFLTDQQRWDTCGCYGQGLPVTPNLDRLAARGTRFGYAVTCQPVCGPARAAIQTGLYPTRLGCFRNDIALPKGQRTIADILSEAGYDTGYVGKWHLASQGDGQDYRTKAVPPELRGGYRDFWMAADVLEFTSHGYGGYVYNGDMEKVGFEGYRADFITDCALEYIRGRGDNPFFLFASYIEPHHQNDRDRFEGPEGSREMFAGFTPPPDLANCEGGNWREEYPDYLGCCWSLDRNLGRIQDELERLGMADNTIVVFTSDHGCHFRTRNAEYKRSAHESSIRIPMVMWGAGVPEGRVVDEIVSLIDLPSTVIAAAGLEPPGYMHGRPMQVLFGDCNDWPQEAFLQISEDHIGRAIRTKRWKYSVWVPGKGWSGSEAPGSPVYHEQFLYDLEADPYEANNLVSDPAYAGVRAELALILKERMARVGEDVPEILPA